MSLAVLHGLTGLPDRLDTAMRGFVDNHEKPADEENKEKTNANLTVLKEQAEKLVSTLQENNGNTQKGIEGLSGIFEKLGASLGDISGTFGEVKGDAAKALGGLAGDLDSMIQPSEVFLESARERFAQMSEREQKLWKTEIDSINTMFANMQSLRDKAAEMAGDAAPRKLPREHIVDENAVAYEKQPINIETERSPNEGKSLGANGTNLTPAAGQSRGDPSPELPEKNEKGEWIPKTPEVDKKLRENADREFLESAVQAGQLTREQADKILAEKYGNDNANAANANGANAGAANAGAGAGANNNDSNQTATAMQRNLPQEASKAAAVQKSPDEAHRAAMQAMAVSLLGAKGISNTEALELYNKEIKNSIEGLAPGAVANNAVQVAADRASTLHLAGVQQGNLVLHEKTREKMEGLVETKLSPMAAALAAFAEGGKSLTFTSSHIDRSDLGELNVSVPGGQQRSETPALPPRFSFT